MKSSMSVKSISFFTTAGCTAIFKSYLLLLKNFKLHRLHLMVTVRVKLVAFWLLVILI
jgi:hypothetical protein